MADDVARVVELYVHPVKGLRGSPVDSVAVEPVGCAGDRRWMVVDLSGKFLTQRQCPAMARVLAEATDSGLLLSRSGARSLAVDYPGPGAETMLVTVWRSTLPARVASEAAGIWLAEALGVACRLVWQFDPLSRPVAPAYGGAEDRVSFADGFPVLLASTSSLDDLNRRLAQPVPMRRFRPNIVVSGAGAWREDEWRRIRLGGAEFRLCKPCDRCIVTTIDQESGERPDPQEPLRTLALFRRSGGGVMFGQNMIPDVLGPVGLGDVVEVLEAGPSNVAVA